MSKTRHHKASADRRSTPVIISVSIAGRVESPWPETAPAWRPSKSDPAKTAWSKSAVESEPVGSAPVEVWGLEPQTYGLQSHRSSHLSYTPADRHRRSTLLERRRPRSTVLRARVVLLPRLKAERFCDNERDWGRAGPLAGGKPACWPAPTKGGRSRH